MYGCLLYKKTAKNVYRCLSYTKSAKNMYSALYFQCTNLTRLLPVHQISHKCVRLLVVHKIGYKCVRLLAVHKINHKCVRLLVLHKSGQKRHYRDGFFDIIVLLFHFPLPSAGSQLFSLILMRPMGACLRWAIFHCVFKFMAPVFPPRECNLNHPLRGFIFLASEFKMLIHHHLGLSWVTLFIKTSQSSQPAILLEWAQD